MAERYYQVPDLPDGVKPRVLTRDNALGVPLTPETMVRAINRGVRPITDKWDGYDYTIPVGYFELQYGAVKHFQARAVVPGSRNPETGKQQSFIGIIGIDLPERCTPFTEAQCEAFGLIPEAIDRGELTSPDARAARLISVNEARARTLNNPREVTLPATADLHAPSEHDAARDILAPPAENEALAEMRQAEAEVARETRAAGGRRR